MSEKGKFLLCIFGSDIGQIFTLAISGYVIESFGWHYAFYYPVIIVIGTLVAWWFVVFDRPADHPRISANEKEHIEMNTVGVTKGLKVYEAIEFS